MAYASIEDVERAWRDVADYERPRFEQMLDDAALWLDVQVSAAGAPQAPAEVLRFLSCNLLRRAVGELDATGANDQWSTQTEPYVQYQTPAVTRSDFYLTKWERSMLGVGCGRAGFSAGGEEQDGGDAS